MTLEDAPMGAAIQIGGKTFIKIAANQYMQKAPICHTRVWDFDYTGTEQTWTAPVDGTYKLEVWGASGGGYDITYHGGYGAYSVGAIRLNQNEKLYVYIGGEGLVKTGKNMDIPGGWNGGGGGHTDSSGSYSTYVSGSGGGASDISTIGGNFTYSNYRYIRNNESLNSRIIVASGGSGVWYPVPVDSEYTSGSNGGGIQGNSGLRGPRQSYNASRPIATGGTQSSGGYIATDTDSVGKGGFGYGGNESSPSNGDSSCGVSGGGGGWYGGGGGKTCNYAVTGGGGSGYIGSLQLTSASGVIKHMTCYNCVTSSDVATRTQSNTCVNSNPTADCSKTGHGHARITLLTVSDGDCYIPECPSGTAYSAKYGDCKPLESFTQIAQVIDFAYTGSEQEFTAPTNGLYKLEVWGAQGGTGVNKNTETGKNDYIIHEGGYGGYAVGSVSLVANQKLYINSGGEGAFVDDTSIKNKEYTGGYNGGGSGFMYTSGGGATHIAKVSGTLNTLSTKQNMILIVAGGGAGTSAHAEGGGYCLGGQGGGYSGNAGITGKYGTTIGNAGTQSSGYSFGLGQSVTADIEGAGAGGGYYGGTLGSISTSWDACGAGGSGYIGNSLLSNKHMTCYDCATSSDEATRTQANTCVNDNPTADCSKTGDGHVRITRLEVP